ncbi:hypothetical protein NF556_12135 [Ornithinimicrobium faecis]|uniref:DUF732 domain-containing protein n=1 Tax=Ornithinimicrobium faecis TaxID=2934158 RepID=A0ABY4YP60_9MICO|nr:hypothetical protein [Ornithinimicrobium sp. HY1793]USQ78394.1 hypothetical protein NF556_12135 [Ornithinimicrobium sp. HY1793]
MSDHTVVGRATGCRRGEMSRGVLQGVGLITVLLLTACGGPQDVQQNSEPPVPSGAVETGAALRTSDAETSVSASSARAGETVAPSDGVLAWKDTPEGWLAGWADSRGIEDPPQVEVVRETRPEEMGELVADCVREQGFEARAFPDQSWETRGGPGQAEAIALAEYVCIAQYPLQPQFYQPLDDARLRQSYEYHVNTTIPCLQDLGYTTPEPPSVEVYVETYRARGDQWIAQTAGDLPFETIDQCPPVPSGDDLFPPN